MNRSDSRCVKDKFLYKLPCVQAFADTTDPSASQLAGPIVENASRAPYTNDCERPPRSLEKDLFLGKFMVAMAFSEFPRSGLALLHE